MKTSGKLIETGFWRRKKHVTNQHLSYGARWEAGD